MTVLAKRTADVARATERAGLVGMGLDRLLSVRSICEALDVSDRGLRRWIGAGIFPKPDLRIGRNLRWRESTIREFINGNGQR